MFAFVFYSVFFFHISFLISFKEAAPNGGLADQWMPNQQRNVTYVSRLQCVQAAVSDQVEKMAKLFPSKRVVLVTV